MNSPGTVRREPGEGFSHAIKIEQPKGLPDWEVIDLWGSCGMMLHDKDVKDWPVVYVPAD